MPFIKEKERESLIRKINQSYGFRKFIIAFEIISLFAFIIVSFLSAYFVNKGQTGWAWWENQELTPLGIGMLVFACIVAVFGIVALILTFSIKSPKSTQATAAKLASAPRSGKRINRTESQAKQVKDRARSFK